MRKRSGNVIVVGDDVFMLNERVATIVLPNSTLRGKFETFLQEMVHEATINELQRDMTNSLCSEICLAVEDVIDDVHKYDSIRITIDDVVAKCIDKIMKEYGS